MQLGCCVDSAQAQAARPAAALHLPAPQVMCRARLGYLETLTLLEAGWGRLRQHDVTTKGWSRVSCGQRSAGETPRLPAHALEAEAAAEAERPRSSPK
jgi:hypothetical protein